MATVVLAVFTFGCDGTRFIFSSSKDLLSTPDDMGLNYEEVWLDTRDGVQLHGWFVPGKPGMPLVLFCHGNAANISHRVLGKVGDNPSGRKICTRMREAPSITFVAEDGHHPA